MIAQAYKTFVLLKYIVRTNYFAGKTMIDTHYSLD